ncbi:RING-H2 finger protein ATL16-like [Solanum dulcamara]|uniref:RING-H2 finger protein ATL16-like n=1 Tax=Solanum dulcamara TaxID=45834 RepID=UPI00248532BD|nr:RING-H2 finger protein ATL16-like [Solanum dulcamara]
MESVSPMRSPPGSSSHAGFPIIVIAIIGIVATCLLLVSHYIFVIKCCLNWHRIDILRRFSFSTRQSVLDPSTVYSPAVENRGLDESVIRSIPVFQYKKREEKDASFEEKTRSSCECAVCLNDFQENEKLRIIPSCAHIFHIDCIDVWLQNNANCPLCRTNISSIKFPQDYPNDNFTGRDEDYVVIEIAENNPTLSGHSSRTNGSNFSRNLISSMGDECLDIRKKDEDFAFQHIRRSFSMDSAADRQLYLTVQEIVQQQRQVPDGSPCEGNSARVIKRSFFSFGHGRGSRNAVLPLHWEP